MGQYTLPSPKTGVWSWRSAAEMKKMTEALNRKNTYIGQAGECSAQYIL